VAHDQLPNYVGVEHKFSTGLRCRVVGQVAFPQSTERDKIVYMLKWSSPGMMDTGLPPV
jgi:hypothetical protein